MCLSLLKSNRKAVATFAADLLTVFLKGTMKKESALSSQGPFHQRVHMGSWPLTLQAIWETYLYLLFVLWVSWDRSGMSPEVSCFQRWGFWKGMRSQEEIRVTSGWRVPGWMCFEKTGGGQEGQIIGMWGDLRGLSSSSSPLSSCRSRLPFHGCFPPPDPSSMPSCLGVVQL